MHLPHLQSVFFQPGEEEAAIERSTETTLTAWFHLNAVDEDSRQWLYAEIPNHYVLKDKKWRPRKRGGDQVISRMYSVSPKDVERFHKRLLLLHVIRANSYEDLRTVNGYLADTFKEACRLRNLLDDDQEWRRCLQEAAMAQMPSQMRLLFVTLCVFCDVANPLDLWNEFKDDLPEDYARSQGAAMAERICLNAIDEQLVAHGYSCSAIGLPTPVALPPELTPASDGDTNDSNQQEVAAIGERNMELLNDEQRRAATAILDAIGNANSKASAGRRGKCFYIDCPGGTGRSIGQENAQQISCF